MKCKACQKPKIEQLRFDTIHYDNTMNIKKPFYSKSKLSKFLIILPKPTKKEYKFRHLIIGQERIMLYNIFKLIGIQNIDILITTVCSCLNSRFKYECFEQIRILIQQLKPKSVILLDNKEKVLEKKLKGYHILIHPKKLLEHGSNWHPNYLQQVRFWKELLT